MKKITTEKSLLKKLNITSIDRIPTKMEQFIDLFPNIDRDLAEKIIYQLPEYGKSCKEIIDSLDSSCERALDSSNKSLSIAAESYIKILDGLRDKLAMDDLNEVQRREITNDMVRVADKISDLHRENQNFIIKILSVILFPLTIIMMLLAALSRCTNGDKSNTK